MNTRELTVALYSKTNCGSDIIAYYYPQARNLFGSNKKFKIREENDASCSLKLFNDCWCVTDWGDEGKPLNPVQICMKEEKVTYMEALQILLNRYNIEVPKNINIVIENKGINDIEGTCEWDYDELSSDDCFIFGPYVDKKKLTEYGWKKVKRYRKVTADKVIIKTSTKAYPIFVRVCCGYRDDEKKVFYKFYEPLSDNKAFRFFYHPIGGKIPNYVNGYYEFLKYRTESIASENYDITPVCICSGERDAMNIYAAGYRPIWFNSETANISESFINKLKSETTAIYACPDIDSTGIREGKKLALQFKFIRVIWLPESLLSKNDWRGNACKDVTDFFKQGYTIRDFSNLARIACEARYIEKDYTGNNVKYSLNLNNLLYYLELNEFGTYEFFEGEKKLVKKENFYLQNISVNDIRLFLIEKLKEEYAFRNEINLVISSNKLTENTFLLLKPIEGSLYEAQEYIQYFLFKNCILKITADSFKTIQYNDYHNLHSKLDLIDHNFKIIDRPFDLYRDQDLNYHVIIKNTNSKFFRFVISTSRINWKSEFERSGLSINDYYVQYCNIINSPMLTETENDEQMQALINKLFVIGYLCYSYKSPSRPWAVYAMDNLVKGNYDSNGRSGKSLFFRFLSMVCGQIIINGRQKKLTENQFLYDRVTVDTKHIVVDDINATIDIGFFYDDIAGDLYVNKKQKQSISIPYARSPKFIFTSNYVPLKLDPSTEGRLLYCTFSDYYHIKTEQNNYPSSYTVFDQFKQNLMTDYSEEDFCNDLNFIMYCVQFYLTTIKDNVKLNPPMSNVSERRNNILIGESFEDWADFYFSKDGELNNVVSKQIAFAAFKSYTNISIKMTQFTKSLKLYAKKHSLLYNYSENPDDSKRIIKKDPITKITTEYIILSEKNQE